MTFTNEETLEYQLKLNQNITSDLSINSSTETTSSIRSKIKVNDDNLDVKTNKSAILSGYITIKINTSDQRLFKSDPWKRRYLVINQCKLFYYNDQTAYESRPEDAINKRPTDLDGYSLTMTSNEAPFLIQLIPTDPEDNRKSIEFRCDTSNEAMKWIEIFQKFVAVIKQIDDHDHDLAVVYIHTHIYIHIYTSV